MSHAGKHSTEEIVHYVRGGRHAFVAADDDAKIDALAALLQETIAEHPCELIDARDFTTLEDFAQCVADACLRLVSSIHGEPPSSPMSLHGFLDYAMGEFRSRDKRGCLIVSHIDPVIERQRTFEIEASFRGAMQRYDDVFIVWLGSENAIGIIGQPDRPFYFSFRTFYP